MNCIQEGIIHSKYYEKSIEKLFSANDTQMKIKYELNNAHVCHDNVCIKISSVLIKNMTHQVFLGLPFINSLGYIYIYIYIYIYKCYLFTSHITRATCVW